MRLGRFALIAAIAVGGCQYWNTHKTIAPAVGVTASMDHAWNAYGYQITPLQKFDFEAVVLRTEHYSMDREAQLAPVDLAERVRGIRGAGSSPGRAPCPTTTGRV